MNTAVIPSHPLKRAKRGRYCTACNGKIAAGSLYAPVNDWNWLCLPCADGEPSGEITLADVTAPIRALVDELAGEAGL